MKKKYKGRLRGRVVGASGMVSGSASILGSYQVCHNLCLAIVAALSFIGIGIVGMPLLFLQKVALPFWIAAIILFFITAYIYFTERCISKNLLIFNLGIIVMGIPLKEYSKYFMIVGSLVVLIAAASIVINMIKKKRIL